MSEILNFMGEHPIITVLIVWSVAGVLKAPFRVLHRVVRSRDIKAHGWPPSYCDADGDISTKEP